jgi:hypothetical protein
MSRPRGDTPEEDDKIWCSNEKPPHLRLVGITWIAHDNLENLAGDTFVDGAPLIS